MKTMQNSEIVHQRLYSQYLTRPVFKSPTEVVEWFGAVQAQDFFGSLWGIGQRMKQISERLVEKAIIDKKIIRTWPMRGTIHFVTSEDIRWMVKLLAPRVTKRMNYYYKRVGLTDKDFAKAE